MTEYILHQTLSTLYSEYDSAIENNVDRGPNYIIRDYLGHGHFNETNYASIIGMHKFNMTFDNEQMNGPGVKYYFTRDNMTVKNMANFLTAHTTFAELNHQNVEFMRHQNKLIIKSSANREIKEGVMAGLQFSDAYIYLEHFKTATKMVSVEDSMILHHFALIRL